jgi:uncharacterized protein YbjT (DUF2867 family)
MSGIFVVIGSRRGVGLEVVKRLCERPSTEVKEIRAVVRDAQTVPEELKQSRATVVVADCTDASSLEAALAGAQAVFFCASAVTMRNYQEVDELGPKVVAEVAKKHGVQRIVLVSSQLVHPRNYWNFVRIMLNTFVSGLWSKKSVMDCKYYGEQHLRRSGVPYTIVRPGRLADGKLGQAKVCIAQCNGHFMSGTQSTRADVAALCMAAALSPLCVNTTFECACEAAPADGSTVPPIVPEELFKNLSSQFDQQFLEEKEQG